MKKTNKYIDSKDSDNIIRFYRTDDNSIGLYNREVQDIYHSKYGAVTESREKFVEHLEFEELFQNKKEVNILDICFGIGYNTKLFLLDFIKSSATSKVCIDAIENDENVLGLCAILKNDKIKIFNINEQKIYNAISNLLSLKTFKYTKSLKISKNEANFIQSSYKAFYGGLNLLGDINGHFEVINSILHNIYYKYLSLRNKITLKSLNNKEIYLNIKNLNATTYLADVNKIYDLIYLDAFSPNKSPKLWTYEFFKRLYEISSQNGIICTYSKAQPVRNAMKLSGFYVGNIVKNGKNIGTIASKNRQNLKNPLTFLELEYLNTKAGICYQDNQNFSLTDEEIISNRKIAIKNSNLIGSSKFKKENKCTI